MDQQPVTPAQEAIVCGMFGGLIVCAAIGYFVLRIISGWNSTDVIVIAIASFVIAAYILPRVLALWFGRSLDDIMSA